MNNTYRNNDLPDDLRLIAAVQIRKAWRISEASLWRLEKLHGKLRVIRIGSRRYFRESDLRAFLDACHASPVRAPRQLPPTAAEENQQAQEGGLA